MSKYRVLACDMDETLLNDAHRIPQNNLDAIHKARMEYGMKFVPNTGRGYPMVQRELKALGLYDAENEYVVSYNGGAITENKGNRHLFFNAVPYQKVCEIADFAKDLDLCIQFYTVDMIYIYRLNENERQRKVGQGVAFTEIDSLDLSFLKEIPVAKVLLQKVDMPYLLSLKPLIAPITNGVCSITFSSGRFMEIGAAGNDKGKGMERLSKLLQIPLSEMIAAGDHLNDIPMLQKAGLSVCPSNAIDEVKAVCDYIAKADNNEGAIAEVLEKFVFAAAPATGNSAGG